MRMTGRSATVKSCRCIGRTGCTGRALDKYHSGGLWTNACCSHPRKGEEMRDALVSRLKEELGLEVPADLMIMQADHAADISGEGENVIYETGTFRYFAPFDGSEIWRPGWSVLRMILRPGSGRLTRWLRNC